MSKIYDEIGKTYSQTRTADARITNAIIQGLNLVKPSTIVDVGAGTGNYSVELAKLGYHVLAVEPSEVMREQGKQHENLCWIAGVAESLPLEESSVEGIISTLAIHHFTDLEQSFSEMLRVVKENGRIVLLIADPRLCKDDCWLVDYFGAIIRQSYPFYKPIDEVVNQLRSVSGQNVEMMPFLIPHDITDGFFASAWRKPQLYLNPSFRAGISPLAKASDDVLQPILQRLENDLKNGVWEQKYGHILDNDDYEGGYRILIVQKG
ncbi:SAM-dependent methyltransferase [Paenibacillaceae bacterium]|nr:SAM-dependent methyltransferase [Paenibacillaceae bacterium]